MLKKGVLSLVILVIIFLSYSTFSKGGFRLGSPVFNPGESIPQKYTCQGDDISPALFWENPPPKTQSFVLIMDDPDAPNGLWVHWVVFNIPSTIRNLMEGELPPYAINGKNSWGNVGYQGPCPPQDIHRYFFKIYALDSFLNLDKNSTKQVIENAMKGHILGSTEFSGTYVKD